MLYGLGCAHVHDVQSRVLAESHYCSTEGFTRLAIDNSIALREAFIVREVAGVVTLTGQLPGEGRVLFEFRPALRSSPVRQVEPDRRGSFRIRDVAPGVYCFKAMAYGWTSVLGVMSVEPDANRGARLILDLPIGN